MNFFGGGDEGPNPLTVAKIEAEILTDMFNRMTVVCNKKCIVSHHTVDLAIGEMSCIDRCVGKYLQAQEKVGGVLNQFESNMKAQEASGMATGPKFGSGPK
jgi:mitochondrial import inner membrane translocase subunit TIM10